MGWNLLFWLAICFPSNIALLASTFYQVFFFYFPFTFHTRFSSQYNFFLVIVIFVVVVVVGGLRFWFYLIWNLITSTRSTRHRGLTTSSSRSSLGRVHCVPSASSLATGSCFCSLFLLLAIISGCKFFFWMALCLVGYFIDYII